MQLRFAFKNRRGEERGLMFKYWNNSDIQNVIEHKKIYYRVIKQMNRRYSYLKIVDVQHTFDECCVCYESTNTTTHCKHSL